MEHGVGIGVNLSGTEIVPRRRKVASIAAGH